MFKSNEKILFKEDTVEGYLSVASDDMSVNTLNEITEYFVETITLVDLLREHGAPAEIDYISVDIEGSELRVLDSYFKSNDFFRVNRWSVEHNFRKDRIELENLFISNGYRLVNRELSYRDYWFELKDV